MESFFLDAPIFSEPNGNIVLLTLKNNIAMRSLRKMEALKSISAFDFTHTALPRPIEITSHITRRECRTHSFNAVTAQFIR